MTAEISFSVAAAHTTLYELKVLLEELCLDFTYDYGGENNIEYFVDGEIIMHEIEDEDIPEILHIIDARGYWPYIESFDPYGNCLPKKDECRAKLIELEYDYDALWKWMKDVAKEKEVEG